MEADSKWLAANEQHWTKGRFDSLNSNKSSTGGGMAEMNDASEGGNSTATSVYEDADCGAGAGKGDESAGAGSLHRRSTSSLNKSEHLYSKLDLLIVSLLLI